MSEQPNLSTVITPLPPPPASSDAWVFFVVAILAIPLFALASDCGESRCARYCKPDRYEYNAARMGNYLECRCIRSTKGKK